MIKGEVTSGFTKVPELGNVTRGASLNFLGAISRSLLGTLFVFVLAKIMTVDEIGLFFLGTNVITFLAIIAVGGLGAGLRRFISIAHGKDDGNLAWDYFNTSIIIVIPFLFIMCLILFLFADELSVKFFSEPDLADVIRTLIPFLILFSLAQLFLSVTQAYKKMQYWVICIDIVNNLLRILIVLLLAFLGLSLYAGIWAYVISILIASILAYHYFRQIMPVCEVKKYNNRVRDLLSFSTPVTFSLIANSGNGLLAVLIVGYFLAASDVGVYSVAMKIVAVGTIVLSSFNTMFSPLISQMHSKKEHKELKILFTCITRWVFSLSLPLYILIAWYSVSISALFGDEYVSSEVCIMVLCLGQVVNALTGPSGNMLLMSGYAFINLWTNFVGLILMIFLNISLIPDYGIVGSAIAGGVALSVVNIVRVFLTWKKLDLHPFEFGYFKPVAAALILVLILVYIGPHRDEIIGIMQLMVYTVLGVMSYFLALLSLGLNQEDRYVLSKIVHRFSNVRS